jgi:hypothetical protein
MITESWYKSLSAESFGGTLDGIIRAQEFFEGFSTILRATEMRLMSAAAAAAGA